MPGVLSARWSGRHGDDAANNALLLAQIPAFLDAPMPDAKGNVLLDFNQARNPPCAFTAFATCPLPPPENRLDLAITAGEKAYRKHAHS